MELMQRRRALLMMPHGIDTSPIIAEYGKFIRNSSTIIEDPNWCYTEWIECYIDGQVNGVTKIIVDAYASKYDSNEIVPHSYVYEVADGSMDHWYGSSDFSEYKRSCGKKNIVRIRWSLLIANLDDCYAYLENTGQIFFAGKNSIYYGHRNISELN